MKNLYKAALLVALGLGGVATTQAQTAYNSDLIIGFTSTTGSDTMFDLGSASSLVNGETWNLDSLISGYTLSSVDWGVIGTTTSGHNSYLTFNPSFGTPPAVDSQGNWTPIKTAVATLYDNFATAGAGESATVLASASDSWNAETLNPTLGTDYINENANPNVEGETSAYFYEQADNGSTPTALGTFSLASDGVVTFDVPEPATYGLLAGGGLLLFSFRHQLRRNKLD